MIANTSALLQHYQLGQGEREALTLTAHLAHDTVLVTDDFLALVVANRLRLPATLFLDFVVARARSSDLQVAEARQLVQAVRSRYPQGFIPHALAMLGRLQP
jgi:predicted nucleic acid-binding protein